MMNDMRKLINQVRNFDLKPINENTNPQDRLMALEKFFDSPGTGGEQKLIRDIYIHFKNGKDIDDLEGRLKYTYLKSPGIFNFSLFSKEEYMKLIEDLAKITDDETFLDEPNFDFLNF